MNDEDKQKLIATIASRLVATRYTDICKMSEVLHGRGVQEVVDFAVDSAIEMAKQIVKKAE